MDPKQREEILRIAADEGFVITEVKNALRDDE